MQLRTFVFEFQTSGRELCRVEVNATDQFAARRLLERQYGKVTIWKTEEKQKTITRAPSSPGGSQTNDDNGEFIAFLMGIVVFAPILAILGGPAWFVYDKLSSQDTHSGIVLLAVLGSLALTGVLLFLIFAFAPQSVLVLAGFVLYGAIGYAFGSDEIWKAIIGGGVGILGAALCYFVGSMAKGSRANDRVVEAYEDEFEDDDDISEAPLPLTRSRPGSRTGPLH